MGDLSLNRKQAYEFIESVSDPILNAFLKTFLVQLDLSFVNDGKDLLSKKELPDCKFDYMFYLKAIELSFLKNKVFLEKLLSEGHILDDPLEELWRRNQF